MSGTRGTPRPRPAWWLGSVAFASVLMALAGISNMISGFGAIFSDDIFVTGPVGALVLNVTGWGWVHLILGVMLVATGIGVLLGALWAQMAAIALVFLHMCSQLMLLPAYPLWSLLIIALGAVVLWALMMHADEVPA